MSHLGSESHAHRLLKRKAFEWLTANGYEAHIEYRVYVARKLFIVDVAGFKNDQTIAIECGHTPYDKIELLRTVFDHVEKYTYTRMITPKLGHLSRKLSDQITYHIPLQKNSSAIFGKGKTNVPSEVRRSMSLRDDDRLLWIIYDGKWYVERA